ncbi:MAG: AMMECR1 family protein [Spirochaetes bacterium]|nr:AMMECR1 family protein [Spirochaetota bacterium]
MELNAVDKQFLLKVARDTLFAQLTDNETPVYYKLKKFYEQKRGVFIKIMYKDSIRAYGGVLEPSVSLIQTVQQVIYRACFNDGRFLPISNEEFEEIDIHLAVVDSIEAIQDHKLIKPQIHGLLIEFKGKSGVILPWDLEEFSLEPEDYITEAALKAGIKNANNAHIKTIKVVTFGEKDFSPRT